MTKQELIAAIQAQPDCSLTKTQIATVLDGLAAVAASAIRDNTEITIPGVAKLATRHKPERNGRNPSTGETIRIPAKRAVVVKPAAEIRRAAA